MQELALYYPYIHVRDDAWLKAAALYWPRLGRIAPQGWPRHDSEVARALTGELDFLVEISPERYAEPVSAAFRDVLASDAEAVRTRFTVGSPGLPSWDWVEWIHQDKLTPRLQEELVAGGLAVRGGRVEQSHYGPAGSAGADDPPYLNWLGMHPDLVKAYTNALADHVATVNRMQVVTDQADAHGAFGGWLSMAELLGVRDEQERATEEVAVAYAVLAVRTVVPAGLEHVPVKKIVKVRRKLAAEFHAFRAHLDALSPIFAELAEIPDPAVRTARLELLIDKELTLPTADLERALTQLGLQPAQGLLSLSSPGLPMLADAALAASGLPPVVGKSGQAAAQLIGSTRSTRAQGREQRRTAAGYLLGLREQLGPRGLVDRARRLLTGSG